MRITGSAVLEAPVEKVWDAILDPAVLARTIPGCDSLATVGQDRYAMTVTAGVAAIKGTYTGEVALSDKVAPESMTLRASGAGAPGTIEADVRVRLSPNGSGGTEVGYEADASVGGAVGGVGQRMLAGVTRKMAGQFFAALDADIAGVTVPPAGDDARAPSRAGASSGPDAEGPGTAVFPGRRALARADANATANLSLDSGATFAAGVLVGGALVLAGVALGARIGKRMG